MTKLLQALERLLYHGEFAAWLNGQEMPWAAAKELEEFEGWLELVRDNELRVDCKR
jgi:hypothetical protein